MITVIKILVLLASIVVLVVRGFVTKDSRGDFDIGFHKRGVMLGAVLVVCTLLLWPAIGTVDSGYRGVVTRFGRVTGRILGEGIYIVTPLAEYVEHLNVQTHSETRSSGAASKDLQQVTTEITLNYYLDPIHVDTVYRNLRYDAVTRIIDPAIQEAVKAATAHYTAEELITLRAKVKEEIDQLLIVRLAHHNILVDTVNITDFDFSETFNLSIEAKVKAVQDSLRAQNELERVQFEAQQKIEQARAEAESLKLQREQITPQLLQLRSIEVQREAVAKWNGQMPTTVWGAGGNSPVPVLDVLAGSR